MSKRDDQKQQNRLKIINAYISLLGHKSFQEITVTDICLEANVARKTLYSHFASKEEILDKVSQRVMFSGAINAFSLTLKQHKKTTDRLNETFSQVSIPLTVYNGTKIDVFIQLIQNLTMRLASYSTKLAEFHEAAYHYFNECKKSDDTKNDFDVTFIADLTVNTLVGIILSWVSDQEYPAQQRMENLKQHIANLILKS